MGNVTHLNSLEVAGVPTMGIGGLLPYTGNWWFVDPLNGSDGNGGTAADPLQTLGRAQTLAKANNNDVVVLNSTATNYLTASLVWAKNQVHLIGVNSGQANGKRSRIAPATTLAGTAGFNNLVSVTAQNCLFLNIGTFYGFSNTAGALICWSDTGGRNHYVNCEFLGFGDGTASTGSSNLTGSRAFKFNNNTGETTFDSCYFGVDTTVRNATNYTMEIAGGAPRMTFNDCTWACDLGASGGASSHILIGVDGIDRWLRINRGTFLAATLSGGTAMAQVFNVQAAAGGVVLMDTSTISFGCTAWETSASNSVFMTQSAVSAPGGGKALVI